jgi:threonine-phosphate decarboxylase
MEKGITGGEPMLNHIRRGFAASESCHHGGRVRELSSSLRSPLLDFSANINPIQPDGLKEFLISHLDDLSHYPDNRYDDLREAAASFAKVDKECIVPGNGSSKIIRLFAETAISDGDRALIPTPTFGEYESQVKLFGAQVDRHDLLSRPDPDDMMLHGAKAAFFCNPNNPTGRLLSREEISRLANRCEENGTFLLIDEAFIELSDPNQSVCDLARDMEYLVVMRSLTKSFAIPGLRLGFSVTNPELAKVMNRARTPWSISSIAASAGVYLLNNAGRPGYLEESRALIRRELSWLTGELKILGLKPLESQVNFILADIRPSGLGSDQICEGTQEERVLVRDCQSFGLGRDYIRVAVRSREENRMLISALKKVLRCRG